MSPRPQPFQSVVRRNLRRLRMKGGWRQEDLALKARARGLRWSASTVTAIEIGRRPVSAGELLLFPTPLQGLFTEPFSVYPGEGADGGCGLLTPPAPGGIGRGVVLTEPEWGCLVSPTRPAGSADR